MGDRSRIEWTDRSDWNPVRGCSRVTEACRFCYAENMAARFSDPGAAFHGLAERTTKGPRWTGKVALLEERLAIPFKWRKPAKVFPNSMSDFFHEDLPAAAIDKIFAVMALCPHLTFQVLTKRAARMLDYCRSRFGGECNYHISEAMMEITHPVNEDEQQAAADWTDRGKPLPNVWLGTSVHDQASADESVPLLLETPAAIRFVSYEPALGPVDWSNWLQIDWQCFTCRRFYHGRHKSVCPGCGQEGGWTGSHAFNGRLMPERLGFPHQRGRGMDWVICGGESGPHARPMHPDWARSVRDQCATAGVAFHFKQWGEWLPGEANYGQFDARPLNSYRRADDHSYEWPPGEHRRENFGCHPDRFSGEWTTQRVGKKRAGRLLDGRTHDDFPQVQS